MIFSNKIWYIYLIFIIIYGCNNITSESKKGVPKNVTIYGTTDDPKVFKYFHVLDFSFSKGSNYKTIKENEEQKNKLKLVFDSIKKSQILEFFSFGDSLNYNTRFFVTPGDSISIIIKNKQILFKGINAAHYNFFYELDPTSSEWGKNKYLGDLKDYKKRCDLINERRRIFFKNYITRNVVSEEFKLLVSAELKFEYLFNLIAPRMKSTHNGSNVNLSGGFIKALIEDYDIEKDGFFDLKEYFNDISINEFKRPKLINNDYFKRSLYDFVKYYFVKSEYLPYTLESFKLHKKYILKHIDGELQDYLMKELVLDYYNNGFGIGKLDREVLFMTIEECLIKNLSENNKIALKEIKHNLKIYGLGINKEAMEESLITLKGDTLKVKELLKDTQNTIKIINFWATWCEPCIENIQKEERFKLDLMNEKNVEWIHISIDKNFKEWQTKSTNFKELIPFKHQYKIINTMQYSKLLKTLKVNVNKRVSIPKYIILGLDGSIISNNAPRPSDHILFQEIIDKIGK